MKVPPTFSETRSIIYKGKNLQAILISYLSQKTLVIGIRSAAIIWAELIVSCNFQSLTRRNRLLVDTRLESTVEDTNAFHSEQLR